MQQLPVYYIHSQPCTQHLPSTFSPGYGSSVLGKKPTNDAIPCLLEFTRNTSRYLTSTASECLLAKSVASFMQYVHLVPEFPTHNTLLSALLRIWHSSDT